MLIGLMLVSRPSAVAVSPARNATRPRKPAAAASAVGLSASGHVPVSTMRTYFSAESGVWVAAAHQARITTEVKPVGFTVAALASAVGVPVTMWWSMWNHPGEPR